MTTAGRNRAFVGLALLLLLLLGLGVALAGRGEARGSSLSRGPNGWLAARSYLQARGARTSLLRVPLDEAVPGAVVVTAFPWQHGSTASLAAELQGVLEKGGTLVVGYSGDLNVGELVALESLGLNLDEARKVSLNPVRWRKESREEWNLRPAEAGAAAVRVWAPRLTPTPPKGAEILLRFPTGRAAVFMIKRLRGRILLLPADALANSRLENPGNADLLETLFHRLGGPWAFDEYHHGLVAGQGVESADFGRSLDLILLHLAVLYVIGLWALSRRFGPAWNEPPTVTGSAGSFLLGLGGLHHRLGHHGEAARRLLERARELDPKLDLPEDLDRRAASAGPRELVELAREVARRRAGKTIYERENAA
ncbi:MAG: DUF4350 domain-containing protein [Thermoanaerobaculia bacterium]